MKVEQKYNNIINFIEDEIAKGQNTQARDILLGIKSEFYIEPRNLSEIFDFLTGMPIGTYIKMRQLMKAAEILLSGGSNQEAIMYTGFGDESSFIKAFNKEFSLSPGNFAKSEKPKIKKPITWDTIVDGTYETTENKVTFEKDITTADDGKNKISDKVFSKFENLLYDIFYENLGLGMNGAKVDLNKRMQKIETMQMIYGFNDELSNVACEVAARFDATIEAAFEFVKQLLNSRKNKKAITEDYDKWVEILDEMIWFYFRLNEATLMRGISFENAVEIYGQVKHLGVKTFTKKHFENLSKRYEPTDYADDAEFLTYSEAVGSVRYTSPDDYEDFFDLYAAYEPYNPYDD